MRDSPRWLALAALLALAAARPARAGEAHYVLVFGSQRVPSDPDYSHSFATFVRVRWAGEGRCRGPALMEAHTISWLPANRKVRTRALLPEPGHNFDLDTTLRNVLGMKQRVSLWGPYPIRPRLYDRALRRIAELESGRVRYKADDTLYPFSAYVTNCIHAISVITSLRRLRVASPGWGEPASYAILLRMRPWLLDVNSPDYSISSALGLDAYPIIYREGLRPPRSAAILGPLFRALGYERGLHATHGPPGAAVTAPTPTPPPVAP